ncbi:MAG: hypothetical protein HY717_11125 [Planctomycetes bacterium]|nr:hypothetical protein [Planctomycetota bacterium]
MGGEKIATAAGVLGIITIIAFGVTLKESINEKVAELWYDWKFGPKEFVIFYDIDDLVPPLPHFKSPLLSSPEIEDCDRARCDCHLRIDCEKLIELFRSKLRSLGPDSPKVMILQGKMGAKCSMTDHRRIKKLLNTIRSDSSPIVAFEKIMKGVQ